MRRLALAVILASATAAGSAVVFVSAPSFAGERLAPMFACGMPELPVVGPAKDRIAAAQKDLKDGRYAQTWRIANSVLQMEDANDAQRAQAHAMLGWVQWRSGSHDAAKKDFAEAKKLDASSIDTVLAIARDTKVNAEVKKALEA
ncbi:MAG TPA: hypothetical protein VMV18_06060 [bacterium]|nr:hypothetical protein [bacterium]